MAAFSDQQNPLSAYDFLSKNTNIEISGFQEPGFDHYPSCILASETQGLENIKKKLSVHEGELGLIEVGKLVRKSNNGSGFRTREELDSSLVQLGDTDHVFQQSLLEKNRGNCNGFLLNSPQSKEKEVCKRKKLPNGSLGKKEEKKLKKNKKKLEKINEEPPCGYIHVRARRGQATDSHSLAERLRREKINKRMKLLQGLIPGCDKVTGKALLLDEIINYVQSLQNQVEILSMKLSYVNPMFYDFSLDSEGIMVNSEKWRSSNPLIPSLQESSQAHQVVGYEQLATFENPTIFPTPSSYHHVLDSSPSILSSDQSTNAFSQDNGNICWKVEDQKPVFIDQDCFKKMGFFL